MSRLDELDIVIRRRNGRVLTKIPQLRLYATGDDIESALAGLDAKKNALVADLEAAGEIDTLEFDDQPATMRRGFTASAKGDLSQFAIKTGIVLVAVIAAVFVSSAVVQSRVDDLVASVKSTKIGGEQFWTKVESELDRVASPKNGLPEAKKQKLLADIRAIAVEWRPFVAEIRSALAGPDNTPQLLATPPNR